MTINKFQGKTKEDAIAKAKKEFGENAVIMNVKEIKPKGIFAIFKSSTYEVTAAMEEKENFVNPMNALKTPEKLHESISLAADERIDLPKPQRVEETNLQGEKTTNARDSFGFQTIFQREEKRETKRATQEEDLQERLNKISRELEEKPEETEDNITKKNLGSDELNFVKILYGTLINNEVNEKYVNQILDEIEKFIRPGNSLDTILSNVYQKLILRFGQPKAISLGKTKPKVIFFIGPTGVGKTTTIAKIASKYKVEQNRRVAFLTADTYRIAATEQLRVYANILDAPMSIIYSADEMNSAISRLEDQELIFVDTAGFSHKNEAQCEDMRKLIQGIDSKYESDVYLVLSATTKYKDLIEIADIYHDISDYKLIFTKLDETTNYGNLLNVKIHSKAELSYVTTGQNVPEDIELFDTQKIVKQLLGGR